ncbi:hypothetical protein GCM10028803_43500 [Larkinella knui]|uniref:DUF4293 family protein n=1 Tax=Larkinella knui TaxID=2025310 RepID=A0A3P1CNR6_9BACT|nr:hypothetical protein [Larkinella knui]RRB14971.1 hypothetical protein EHT87_10445 [Larkinella knui]
MRNNLFYYLVLLILVAVDAWLLAHPNLIGQISIFWYDHDYLETLPKAMATVGATVLAALLVSLLISRALSGPLAVLLAVSLFVICLFAVFQTYTRFSSGTYQFMGSGFKTGAVLLPVILAIIFGKTSYDVLTTKKPKKRR